MSMRLEGHASSPLSETPPRRLSSLGMVARAHTQQTISRPTSPTVPVHNKKKNTAVSHSCSVVEGIYLWQRPMLRVVTSQPSPQLYDICNFV